VTWQSEPVLAKAAIKTLPISLFMSSCVWLFTKVGVQRLMLTLLRALSFNACCPD
jgi:hypothetical protein